MHPIRRYRGSPRRLSHLDWRRHTPWDLWILAVLTLCAVAIVLSWLSGHVSE
jgi:hypothetical protein